MAGTTALHDIGPQRARLTRRPGLERTATGRRVGLPCWYGASWRSGCSSGSSGTRWTSRSGRRGRAGSELPVKGLSRPAGSPGVLPGGAAAVPLDRAGGGEGVRVLRIFAPTLPDGLRRVVDVPVPPGRRPTAGLAADVAGGRDLRGCAAPDQAFRGSETVRLRPLRGPGLARPGRRLVARSVKIGPALVAGDRLSGGDRVVLSGRVRRDRDRPGAGNSGVEDRTMEGPARIGRGSARPGRELRRAVRAAHAISM